MAITQKIAFKKTRKKHKIFPSYFPSLKSFFQLSEASMDLFSCCVQYRIVSSTLYLNQLQKEKKTHPLGSLTK